MLSSIRGGLSVPANFPLLVENSIADPKHVAVPPGKRGGIRDEASSRGGRSANAFAINDGRGT